MVEYTLTLTSKQAHEVNKAVELLMRLKIKQPEDISRTVLPWGKMDIDEYCRRRDGADVLLKKAFDTLFPTWDDVKKDEEWHMLYNIYQVIRKAIHDAEHPSGTGVDSYPPINSGGAGLPKIKWEEHK